MAVSRKKLMTLEALIERYKRKQEQIVLSTIKAVIREMDMKAEEIAYLFSGRTLRRGRYLPQDVVETIERLSRALNDRIREILVKSLGDSILLSEAKNNEFELFTFKRKDGKLPKGAKKVVIKGPFSTKKGLATAISGHTSRLANGYNLSKRIWKLSNQWKSVISKTVTEGLKNGTAARKLVPQLRNALRNNKWQDNPGRGIYKSPVKNAMRLSRNEINLAYANADHTRWQMIETVVGVEVRLSNNHPTYDICDEMKGRYPKDFKFTLWHPNCKCIAIPVLATQEERDALLDYRLGLRKSKPKIEYIDSMPSSARQWIRRNGKRVENWKNKPYWIRENKKHFESAL